MRYNYDFVLEQHYFELGIRHEFSKAIWAKARFGIMNRKEDGSDRPGASPKPFDERTIWDLELNIGNKISEKAGVFAKYTHHETAGARYAAGLTTNFSLLD